MIKVHVTPDFFWKGMNIMFSPYANKLLPSSSLFIIIIIIINFLFVIIIIIIEQRV
jgi:hypothetical protein